MKTFKQSPLYLIKAKKTRWSIWEIFSVTKWFVLRVADVAVADVPIIQIDLINEMAQVNKGRIPAWQLYGQNWHPFIRQYTKAVVAAAQWLDYGFDFTWERKM